MNRERTDWDQYYRSPFPASRVSRSITSRVLVDMLSSASGVGKLGTIAEIGGANSCFLPAVTQGLQPDEYHIIDSNALGLSRTKPPAGVASRIVLHEADVLNLKLSLKADCVFSVGLIEHFDVPDTRRAVGAHFEIAKPGGIVLISFPTPTALYRSLRFAAETLGKWMFPDERPLGLEEVRSAAAAAGGEMLDHRLIWPIGFTQRMAVFRKRPDARVSHD